jgi:hypothetical protein
LQDVVFVVIGLVVVVFAFVLGSLGRGGDDEENRAGRLEGELEVERRRVGELEAELERLRAERS